MGFFITLEGPEGSGKSTQAKMLVSYLEEKGYQCVLTREPGGTKIGETIREILLKHSPGPSIVTELFLYAAARRQHVDEIIRPALEADKIVICDRFADATVAYQGYGRDLDLEWIRQVNYLATDGLTPELTLLLDINPQAGMERALGGREPDRMEQEAISFHHRVREGYLELAQVESERIKIIKADRGKEEVHKDIRQYVDEALQR
ncbi:MAG: dTMP kinase [bacterium]|nr:dTMP kinase [bacterium]